MCGFFVYFSHTNTEIDPGFLQRATSVLEHRGPDDFGYAYIGLAGAYRWKDVPPSISMRGGVAMGHRRLSILDLSDQARQPFSNQDSTLWMVYNGEIYNYIELRQELIEKGCCFRTDSDTEVLLAAYQYWGVDCFQRFNGMWSVVIWDQRQRSLILSRDRLGIKPLSFARVGDDWMFASEKKALLCHRDLSPAPNSNSVLRYLSRKAAPILGESFYQNIDEVKPGTVVQISKGRVDESHFWTLPVSGFQLERSLPEAAEHLSELIADAVKLRLRSDVKVGTMVSGGLDSTTVIQKMVEQKTLCGLESASMGESLQGFHASFPNLPIDEAQRVDELAGMMDMSIHKVFPAQVNDVEELMLSVSRHLESPFFNSVPIVHTLLMRCAREQGVKVVLNGHGADEMLAGYPPLYHPVAAAGFIQRGEFRHAVSHIDSMAAILGVSKVGAWLKAAEYILPHRLQFWRTAQSKGYAESKLFKLEHAIQLRDSLPEGHSILDSALRRDLMQTILPNWLNMEDRISMSQSIESRLPFLDYRVVEYAFSLADSLKIRSGKTKVVLRQAMAQKLPASILSEKQKFYFSGPDAMWLRGALRPLLTQYFLNEEPRISAFVHCETLRNVVIDFLKGEDQRVSLLWNMFSTECWLRSA